jgi:endo-1,4-beta-xylanase
VNPLHEYYIVEDWYDGRPQYGTQVGTFNDDGDDYDILTATRTDAPSIIGTATFVQFWSVRKTARQCGTISVSQHFAQWASMGMGLGDMEEASLLVEVTGGTGSIDFTTATVTAK